MASYFFNYWLNSVRRLPLWVDCTSVLLRDFCCRKHLLRKCEKRLLLWKQQNSILYCLGWRLTGSLFKRVAALPEHHSAGLPFTGELFIYVPLCMWAIKMVDLDRDWVFFIFFILFFRFPGIITDSRTLARLQPMRDRRGREEWQRARAGRRGEALCL